jgi:hypothetical protein
MSHAIDIDGTTEKLFLLQHLAYGSEAYCRSEGMFSAEHLDYSKFQSPWGWTKAVVSNYLIECAVKLRMIQEYGAKRRDSCELAELDKAATLNLQIGRVLHGGFQLTLRESFNKIVHATNARMEFTSPGSSTDGVHCWDGMMHLVGEHHGKPWSMQLSVANWAKACLRYLDLADDQGLLDELGQDWS